jgi:hypothetical protein
MKKVENLTEKSTQKKFRHLQKNKASKSAENRKKR